MATNEEYGGGTATANNPAVRRNITQNQPGEMINQFVGQDGLKWIGMGFCMLAGAVALHGLFSGNSAYSYRRNSW